MSEKPIIFSTQTVRAILDGRKTMTRRTIKPQTVEYFEEGKLITRPIAEYDRDLAIVCSPYMPGFVLWVRETWQDTSYFDPNDGGYVYRATDPDWETTDGWKWRSPIHIPRAAARLFLRVTGVRAERLQDISEEDAIKEGIEKSKDGPLFFHHHSDGGHYNYATHTEAFAGLWDGINAKRKGCSWADNPWVWVYEFERIATPENGGQE